MDSPAPPLRLELRRTDLGAGLGGAADDCHLIDCGFGVCGLRCATGDGGGCQEGADMRL